MPADDTRAVFEHHTKAVQAGDLDATMEDYTEDSVFITNLGGVVKGLDSIRATFAAVGEFPGYEETSTHIEGDFAYVAWKMTGIPFATDTFVIREGKIVLQTAALFFG